MAFTYYLASKNVKLILSRYLVAQLGAYSGPFHWKNRKFALKELKRLQSFPDDYQFFGSPNAVLKQIGNSVPPIFAEKLTMAVLQQVFAIDLDIELLNENEQLSFDSRKSKRAKSTRIKRLSNSEDVQLNLFESVSKSNQNEVCSKLFDYDESIYWNYLSLKHRKNIRLLTPPQVGSIYKFHFQRNNESCSIYVSRYKNESFIDTPLLQYQITFHHLIGNGLKKIMCTLLSDSAQDIPIAWDAIEDCLSRTSGYQSMMDIYGHFTEPHPIFNLGLDVFSKESSFLIKFIKEFSQFESTTKVLPINFLKSMYSKKSFDLLSVVRELRELRFDIRIHETNETIPYGYFRCCYPFTININKQVSVKLKSRNTKIDI